MSSKHTPGPWAVHDHPTDPNQFGHHVTTVDGLTICSVTYQLPVQTAKGAKEATRVANARLIAAAPELYEAVAAVIDATRDYLPPNGITKDEFISRVIAATDNTRMAEIMK